MHPVFSILAFVVGGPLGRGFWPTEGPALSGTVDGARGSPSWTWPSSSPWGLIAPLGPRDRRAGMVGAYLVILWTAEFGGYLMGSSGS